MKALKSSFLSISAALLILSCTEANQAPVLTVSGSIP